MEADHITKHCQGGATTDVQQRNFVSTLQNLNCFVLRFFVRCYSTYPNLIELCSGGGENQRRNR
jgi:hypothetical protein